ncbi:hypothetical protein C0J52_15221 [Blattella germanica]|nr:hypothetical protein C0J52_15221 [Blattella germanica]
MEKEERNRDMRREGDKNFAGSESRRYEKRGGYESTRGGREGFAPRGEPSRRGRGGFRSRGSVGRRMDGYGPPSSKSPFGQPPEDSKLIGLDEKDKENRKNVDPHGGESNKEDIGGEIVSSEDKMKLKQQALSAGIIGSGARHHPNSAKVSSIQVPPRMQRKSESERRDSSRSKGTRGSSGGRGGNHGPGREQSNRPPRSSGVSNPSVTKQNSSDVGDECWETTSENSELDDRERKQEVRNGRKAFRQRDAPGNNRRSSGLGLSNSAQRTGRGGSGGLGPTQNSGGSSGSSRAPGAEKRAGNNNGYNGNGGQRGTSSPAVGLPQQTNGRAPGPRSNGNQSPGVPGNKLPLKETTTAVNRVDDIKLNDPALVTQALSDLNSTKKNARVEKEKSNVLEGIDLNNYASVVIVDDQPEVTMEEERFTFDADNGFQEVRSKKNVKEARQKGAVEEQKVVRAPREQKERERGERERDRKGKSAGTPPVPPGGTPPGPGTGPITGPPPPVMGQGSTVVKPQFERPRQSKLPPRFAKQRENNRLQKAAQQQQQHQQHVGVHNDVSEMNKINQSVSIIFPLAPKGTKITLLDYLSLFTYNR